MFYKTKLSDKIITRTRNKVDCAEDEPRCVFHTDLKNMKGILGINFFSGFKSIDIRYFCNLLTFDVFLHMNSVSVSISII